MICSNQSTNMVKTSESSQSDQPSRGALWLAKDPRFNQAESKNPDLCVVDWLQSSVTKYFFLIILFDNPLKYNQNNIMTSDQPL